MPSTGKTMEQFQPSYVAGEEYKMYSHCEKWRFSISSKGKHILTNNSAIHFWSFISEKWKLIVTQKLGYEVYNSSNYCQKLKIAQISFNG